MWVEDSKFDEREKHSPGLRAFALTVTSGLEKLRGHSWQLSWPWRGGARQETRRRGRQRDSVWLPILLCCGWAPSPSPGVPPIPWHGGLPVLLRAACALPKLPGPSLQPDDLLLVLPGSAPCHLPSMSPALRGRPPGSVLGPLKLLLYFTEILCL